MPGPVAAIAGGSLVGGLAQAGAARSASRAQTRSADQQVQLGREQLATQRDIYNEQRGVQGDVLRANLGIADQLNTGTVQLDRDVRDAIQRQAGDVFNRNTGAARDAFGREMGILTAERDASLGRLREGFDFERGVLTGERDASLDYFNPFIQGGQNALAASQYEMGLGDRPDGFSGLSMSPAARFALEQGRDTIEAGAAARGGLNSGATLQALERERMGMAAMDRETQLDRLLGMSNQGLQAGGMAAGVRDNFAGRMQGASQFATGGEIGVRDQFAGRAQASSQALRDGLTAASTGLGMAQMGTTQNYGASRTNAINNALAGQMAANTNFGAGMGNAAGLFSQGSMNATQMQANALANRGDAQAAGAIGMGNAISSGFNNAIGGWQMNQLMNRMGS